MNSKPDTYSIGDLAREFAVTTRTIRYCEDAHKLSLARSGGHQRVFGQRDRVRLKLILRGKRLGFALAEIRKIIDLYDAAPGEAGQLRLLLEKIARPPEGTRGQTPGPRCQPGGSRSGGGALSHQAR